jgi:ABC-2 type transport system ATP-binding protein
MLAASLPAAHMSRNMILVQGLVKRYGSRTAVDGVSFCVQAGEVFGLLGPNGAGKTTTISILATLLRPDAGQVSIGGYDLLTQTSEVKKLIGFVPQELALYPTLSAWDNLAFFGCIYGLHGRALHKRIAAALDLVRLRDRASEAVRHFSGGMKRRLNIAAGLVHQPQVLFLDEPTVGVDPQSRNFIFEYVEQLKAEGMTIIYTTHYMEEAERLCDRVAIIDEGRIVAMDTVRSLVNLLGGGVIYVSLAPTSVTRGLLPTICAFPHVQSASIQDSRLKIETRNAPLTLSALIEVCSAHNASILSLEVLEPNLESVFLHLTGKSLRN